MKKFFAAVAVILSMGVGAAMALDPKNIETDWDWDVYYTSLNGVSATTANVDIAGLGAGVSASTRNVVGFRYTIQTYASTATFTISHLIKEYGSGVGDSSAFNNPSPASWYGTGPLVSTSTTITVPSNMKYEGVFEAMTVNPFFSFTNLTSGNIYLWVEFGRKRFVR